MKHHSMLFSIALLVVAATSSMAQGREEAAKATAPVGQQRYPLGSVIGDAMPGAPALAARGPWHIGVRTIEAVNPRQLDIVASLKQYKQVMSDRRLKVEVWYPAVGSAEPQITHYTDYIGRSDKPGTLRAFTFVGRAGRNAAPDLAGGPYPVIIVSHGYPGSRYLMSYLCENLASKGYVVAAIAHTDSTYADVQSFLSTLVNRSPDQEFVVGAMLRLGASDGFLHGMVDPERVGLIGYSMGAYGALRTLGAGANDVVRRFAGKFADPIMAASTDRPDSRIKAAVLFAPWGGSVGSGRTGLWDTASLAKITVPTFWVAGSEDDIAGYEGIVHLFEAATNSPRVMLTYDDVLHNSAPNPAPPEATTWAEASRWADPVWDTRRLNNINQHFVTAFMDYHLKGDTAKWKYLHPKVEYSNDGVVGVSPDSSKVPSNSYWPGFPPRSALGMHLRPLMP